MKSSISLKLLMNSAFTSSIPLEHKKKLLKGMFCVPGLLILELTVLVLLSRMSFSRANSTSDSEIRPIALIIFVLMVRTIASWKWSNWLTRTTLEINRTVGKRIVRDFLNTGMEIRDKFSTSGAIRSIDSALGEVVQAGLLNFFFLIHDIPLVVAILGLVIYLMPVVGIFLVIIMAGGIYIYSNYVSKKLKSLNQDLEKNMVFFISRLFFLAHNARSISALGLETEFANNYDQARSKVLEANSSLESLLIGSRYFIEILIYVSVSIYFVTTMLTGSTLSTTYIIVIGLRLIPPAHRALHSATRVKSTFQSFVDLESNLELFKLGSRIKQNGTKNSGMTFDLEKGITLSDVSYRYSSNSKFLFKELDLSVKIGEFVAITGRVGSGKSTLLDIVLGLRQSASGIVDFFGKSPAELTAAERQVIGLVPQEVPILSGTWRENLMFMSNVSISDSELYGLLETVKLSHYCDGLDTNIGDSFRSLSGGEKQLLGLARALVRIPKLLVLDEVTSNLDMKTEKMFLDILAGNRSKMAVIFVTHRIAPIDHASTVISLERFQ